MCVTQALHPTVDKLQECCKTTSTHKSMAHGPYSDHYPAHHGPPVCNFLTGQYAFHSNRPNMPGTCDLL